MVSILNSKISHLQVLYVPHNLRICAILRNSHIARNVYVHYAIKQVVIEHNMLISTNPPWSVLFPVHVFHHKSHRTHSVNGTVSEHTPCTVEQRKYHSFTANVVTVTVSNVRTDLNQGDGIKLGHAHITLFLEPQSTIQFTDSIKLCHLS